MTRETFEALENMRLQCLGKLGDPARLSDDEYRHYHELLLESETILESHLCNRLTEKEEERALEIENMLLSSKEN